MLSPGTKILPLGPASQNRRIQMKVFTFLRILFNSISMRLVKRLPRNTLSLEELEPRTVPTTAVWIGPTSGNDNWSDAANWSTGSVPNSTTLVVFGSSYGGTDYMPSHIDGSYSVQDVLCATTYQGFSIDEGITLTCASGFYAYGTVTIGVNNINTTTISTPDFYMGAGSTLTVGDGIRTGNVVINASSSYLVGATEVKGYATLSFSGSMDVSGAVTIDASAALSQTGGSYSISFLLGSSLTLNSFSSFSCTSESSTTSGTVTAASMSPASVSAGSGWAMTGTLVLDSGDGLNITADVNVSGVVDIMSANDLLTITGNVEITAGEIDLPLPSPGGNPNFNVSGSFTIDPGYTSTLQVTGTMLPPPPVIGAGAYSGNFTVVTLNGSAISPGSWVPAGILLPGYYYDI